MTEPITYPPMRLLLQIDEFGSLYSLDPHSDELHVTPIYADDTVNLADWGPVDMARIAEEDLMEAIAGLMRRLQSQLPSKP